MAFLCAIVFASRISIVMVVMKIAPEFDANWMTAALACAIGL